jgi:hypothetical protein
MITLKQDVMDDRKGLPSASAWSRYELCAGSFQLEGEAIRLGQAAHQPTKDSVSGERIHTFLAGIPDEDGKEIKLDDTEQATADTLQDLATSQIERIFGDQPYGKLTEKRLWLTLKGELALSGQFDLCAYRNELALIQDFKTGHQEPEPAESNAQLKILSVLVALALLGVKEVIAQIISPYFGVTEARFSLADLSEAYNDILRTLEAIHDERAALVPGPVQCKRCPAINICQAVKNTIRPIAKLQISELPDDADRAGRLLDEVDLLQEHLDEIRAYYKGRLSLDPTYKVTHWAMVPGAERRDISDWAEAIKRLRKYVPDRDLESAAGYTLGEIERLLGKALELKPKPAKDKLNAILEGLIVLKPNAASLKRVNGKAKITVALSDNL